MEITNKEGTFGIGTSMSLFKPQRKKPCLYVRDGNACYKIASFNDRDAMEDFWRTMFKLGLITPRDLEEITKE